MKTYIIDMDTYVEITGYDPEDEAMMSPEDMGLSPIDRDALLALAEELEQETGSVCGVCMGKTARRIREACGAVDAD